MVKDLMVKVKLTEEQRELLRIMDVDIHSYDAATNTCELRDCIFDALQRLKVDLVEVKEPELWNENVEICSDCGIEWKKINKPCPVCYSNNKPEFKEPYTPTNEEIEHCREMCKSCINFTGNILSDKYCKINRSKTSTFSCDKKQNTHCSDFIEIPKFNEPWNLEGDDIYYYIDSFNFTVKSSRCGCAKVYNRFKYRERAEQCVKKMKINNTLEAFSLANGGGEIDWNNTKQVKYFFAYSLIEKKFEDDCTSALWASLDIPFISKEVLKEAIRRYGDEFMEAYKIEEAISECME